MDHPPQLPSSFNREAPARYGEAQGPAYRVPYAERLDLDSGEEGDFQTLLEYWNILYRRKVAILALALLGGLAGFGLSFLQTPVYRARTSLEIQGVRENNLDTQSVNVNSALYDIQTQLKLLQSRTLIKRVLSKLSPPQDPSKVKGPDPPSGWPKALGLPLGLSSPTVVDPREEALSMAAGSLEVSVTPDSRILEIFSESTDPQVAADFANNLVNEYIQQSLEERWNVYQRTGDWLTRAQEDLKNKLEKSEEKLNNYARSSGLLLTSEKENVAEAKLRQLQEELSKAQADRILKQAQYGIVASGKPESLPEVLDSGPLHNYQVQLADLRRQLAELSSSLTPAHYKVKRVQAQINELEAILTKERSNVTKRIRNEYQSAVQREKLLASSYADQSRLVSDQAGKFIQYNMLKREVDTNRQLYETTLQRGKEASIASALRASNARVVDPANPPPFPFKPNRLLTSALGLVGGLFLASGFAVFRGRTDRSIQRPGDMALQLNLRELGVIPSARVDPEARALRGRRPTRLLKGTNQRVVRGGTESPAEKADGWKRNGQPGECVELVTWARKPSLMAESFRATLASILFSSQNEGQPQVIVLTSPSPREGKSTVVSNLAIALAEINRHVLLIDADMRKPRLHSIFDRANTWGLSDILRERISVEDYPNETLARETEIPGLYLLPSGPGTVSIASLLYSVRFLELLRRFRREFETVLIDTAPMLQIPDARILGRLADAVILVFRAGQTMREEAIASTQLFEEDGTPVLGTILNDWDPKAAGHNYYKGYYSHYYRRGNTS
jgi:polysaccharide biosynthesis transport protein